MEFSKVEIDGQNDAIFCLRLFHYLGIWEPVQTLFSEVNRLVTRGNQELDCCFRDAHVRQELQAAGLMNG